MSRYTPTNLNGGPAVFNVDASNLSQYAKFYVNLNGASTAVINVDTSGASGPINISSQFGNENDQRQNVLWNFGDSSQQLNFQTEWGGVVLAPNAEVTNNTPIEGVLVADSFNGGGELHDYQFDGTLPGGSSTVAVPEPGDLGMFGLGLAMLGLIGWTRRKHRTHIG